MNEQQEKMMQCVAGIAVFDHSYGRDELKALLLRELLTPDGITPLLSDENAACLADMFRGIAPTNTKEGTEAAIKAATAAIESLFTPSRKHQRMTPSERLRAAAAKLRAMNEAATAGQWGVSGWTGAPQFVTITGPVEEPLGRVEYPPKTVCSRATVTDSALIVALRNTATEQSAMMQAVADRLERGCSDTCSNALSSEYTCDCGHDALESAATAWCEAVEREGQ